MVGSLKWKFKTGGDVESSPAIAQDGTIYAYSDEVIPWLYNIYFGGMGYTGPERFEIWKPKPMILPSWFIVIIPLDPPTGTPNIVSIEYYINGSYRGTYQDTPFTYESNLQYIGLNSGDFITFYDEVAVKDVNGNVLWEDDFESYSTGSWPSNWVQSGNASAPGNGIIDTIAYAGSKCLQLKGSFGGCWEAIAYRQFPQYNALIFEFAVYPTGIGERGCHHHNGASELKTGSDWTYKGRGLIEFNVDSMKVYGPGWLYLGNFNFGEWYEVKIVYKRPSVVEISTIEPPFLEIKSFEVVDENGDGVFSAGEDACVKVKIENSGKGDANNVELKLSGFVERSLSIGKIGKGEIVSKEVYFRVPLGIETAKESIKLFVDAGDYSPEPVTISLYTQAPIPPAFSVSVKVDDDKTGLSLGDGDGKIEPRETIELHVKIRNTGKGDANGVAVEVLPKDERIKVVKSRDELGNLPSGAEVEGVVAFFIPSGYPEDKVPVEIKITENTGLWTVAEALEFEVGKVSSRKYEIKPESVITEGSEFTTTITVEEKEGEEKGLPEHPIFQNPNRLALVIGVGDYKKLPKLPCSINDARLMKEIVKKLMGVKDENLKYLENPTLAEMHKGFSWLITKAKTKRRPWVLIYYSGHGATDINGEAYWLPVDADNNARYLPVTAMKVEEVYKKLQEIRDTEVVIIVDACYSGKGKSVMLADAKPLVVTKIKYPKGHYSLLLASRADEISTYLDIGYSAFTYALYKTLTSGDILDNNENGWLEISEIKSYLTKKTKELSAQKGIIQIPVIEGTDTKLSQVME